MEEIRTILFPLYLSDNPHFLPINNTCILYISLIKLAKVEGIETRGLRKLGRQSLRPTLQQALHSLISPIHFIPFLPNSSYLCRVRSREFPELMICCWAVLWARPSVGVPPIFRMASPTWRPHLAAKLPGVTYSDGKRGVAGCEWVILRYKTRFLQYSNKLHNLQPFTDVVLFWGEKGESLCLNQCYLSHTSQRKEDLL